MVDAVLAERFWDKVSPVPEGPLGCTVWLGCLSAGRATLWVPELGRAAQAARIAFELSTGVPVPDHLEVLHACDHGWCVRGDHLSVGTHAANMAAMAARARSTYGPSLSRLPESERVAEADRTARAIRSRHREIAQQRGVQAALF